MGKRGSRNQVTIEGRVKETMRDEEDQVTGVCIATDIEEFLVQADVVGKELLALSGEEVEVTGTVTKGKNGTMSIKVTGYEVLDEEEDDEVFYDEEDGGSLEEDREENDEDDDEAE